MGPLLLRRCSLLAGGWGRRATGRAEDLGLPSDQDALPLWLDVQLWARGPHVEHHLLPGAGAQRAQPVGVWLWWQHALSLSLRGTLVLVCSQVVLLLCHVGDVCCLRSSQVRVLLELVL